MRAFSVHIEMNMEKQQTLMCKIFIVTALGFSLTGLPVFASENNEAQQLQNKLSAMKSYSANFIQVVTDVNSAVLQEAEGVIKMQQPHKLYWEVHPPNEATLVADGNTLWHLDPYVEQVIAMDQHNAVRNHPIMMLAESEKTNWDEYSVSIKEGAFIVSPKSENQQVKQLILSFKKNILSTIKVIDQQGQTNHLTFNNIRQNATISERVFQFSVPEGFELDDQR